MPAEVIYLMASFTVPQEIGTNPQAFLWLLPLAAAIVVTYKATKLPTITAGNFIKETAALFGSIVVFMALSGLILYVLAWLFTE